MISGSITYHCYDCSGDHYYVDYIVTENFQSEVTEDSPAASLISGGDLLINADTLNNEHSLISADGDLSFNLGALNNLSSGSFDLTRTTTYYSGRITDGTHHRSLENEIGTYNRLNSPTAYYYVDRNSCAASTAPFCSSRYRWVLGNNPNYNVDAIHSSYNPFRSSYVVRGTEEDITNTGQASSSSIQAGGTANITIAGVLNNDDVRQNAELPTQTSRSENTAANGRGLQDVTTSTTRDISVDSTNAEINGQTTNTGQVTGNTDDTNRLAENNQRLTLVGYNPIESLTLPQTEDLFVINRDADHPYLVETNPEFAQYTHFISSDYFFAKIGLAPELTPRRLGDGFYEMRLIRKAVFETSGRRYLDGQQSDQAQFQYLMDNAIAAREDLELSIGITLNADQVARLTHDIIWVVEQEVLRSKRISAGVLRLCHSCG